MRTRKVKSKEHSENISDVTFRNKDFPIVGIGASAGGLEALELFFGNMPADSGMAYVVIQHLDPNRLGIMPEILQRFTIMKVYQATDCLLVKPDCIYVIPPNKSMSILNGELHLFTPVEVRGLRLPIDIFFRSLADDRHEKSIGIILSGMGSDGSMGLKAIKEKNGIVLVQDPANAKFDGMPCSAIDAVIADIVADANDLPSKLISFLRFVPVLKTKPEIDINKSNIDKIILLIRDQTGHDFSLYKRTTLFRRIERRKGVHQIEKINNYVRFLQENPKEVEILFKELLIGVTSFFRDADVWNMLKENVIPSLINELPDGYNVRAWVTGCSTGEEAYSLAIVFREVIEKIKKGRSLTLTIFATDLDTEAVEKARQGYYQKNIISDVSPGRLDRFFTPEADCFRVNAIIREMVVFANQNLIKDPPFTRLNILTCRNMLIYMESELQSKLISLFNYSLNPGGIMILGTSEALGNHTEEFEDIDSRLKIFRRSATLLTANLIDFPSSFHRLPAMKTGKEKTANVAENIQNLADQVLLQRFSPASVLVNDRGDIIYITGHTGKYLEPLAGKANWNIYAMAREGLREILPGAFRNAMQSFNAVTLHHIKIGTNSGVQYVDVTVQRIETPPAIRGMVMVIFSDVPAVAEHYEINKRTLSRSKAWRTRELEIELQRSYENLQSLHEEMQTSQEELKSTNEELQSTNEELQSTNEELTTSKEEMQSLNEELQTVNAELQIKVSDFAQANNDMNNLLNSIEIATLFLDKDLHIRRFTDPATEIFKLRKTDIGRPFTDLVTELEYYNIENDARHVLRTLSIIETSVPTSKGKWFKVKILPYRTVNDHIEGLVITFIDITEFKRIEAELKKTNDELFIKANSLLEENRYRRLFESAKDGILIINAETGMITHVNPFLIDLLGFSEKEFMEKAIWEIGLLKDIVDNKGKFLELRQLGFVRYSNLPLVTAEGRQINVEFISNVYEVN